MTARHTQIISAARRTEYASRDQIDPADKLYGMVKAYNMRKDGRAYGNAAPDSLFEAVKAYNTRRLG